LAALPGSGVDPDGAPPPVDLLDDDLLAYRAAHPLAAVMPVIRRLLVADAEVDQMIVAVTDAADRGALQCDATVTRSSVRRGAPIDSSAADFSGRINRSCVSRRGEPQVSVA
jgi:hypothetical protein